MNGCEIGIVGLGTMGRNLALNFADRGFRVAGYDRDAGKVRLLETEAARPEAEARPEAQGAEAQGAGGGAARAQVEARATPEEFVAALKRPRAVLLLVPAGNPVDSAIRDLTPLLEAGDLLIDAGNSHFTDTDRRSEALSAKGIRYLGVGISGGEEGARHGPSIMPGGTREAYARVREILEAAAARVDGDPCVAWLGPGSAGHFVKMVHNGIEYGIMELIAETYDLMQRGLGFSDDELHDVYASWNSGELSSYLIEITARIFRKSDPETKGRLVDSILDEAEQLGTGMWTSQAAMDLGVPVPTIDAAVAMRSVSAMKEERTRASRSLPAKVQPIAAERVAAVTMIGNALFTAVAITYAQGMALLRRASEARRYNLDLEAIARIWRGGCIIRAALLERIRSAYRGRADLPNLLLDPDIGGAVTARQGDLRAVVAIAARAGIPVAAMMASLAYLDAYRSERLPANLIQAQRDYFGAHTYRRIDRSGVFHTEWKEEER